MKNVKLEYKMVRIFSWFVYFIIILGTVEISYIYKDYSYLLGFVAIAISMLTMMYSITIQLKNEVHTLDEKQSERKVEVISSTTSANIKTELEDLYNGKLKGKAIDKIEVVNSLTDHSNENRKDIIIIYH